jgi:hypothetical protein
LGTAAGSSADAYLSASPNAYYIGFDWYESPGWLAAKDEESGEHWDPQLVLNRLLTERGFQYEIRNGDLRSLTSLPQADFVVVDAAHDFENEYADLKLAVTANPEWIFVDDAHGECLEAINKFLGEHSFQFTARIEYGAGAGMVIKT